MTLKTLLLSSAAAVVVAGGAQAADLSIAEPVESVRVCDAFGTGYWYIPGTETCLKIGGSVEFDVNLHALAPTLSADGSHSSNWDFVTTAKLNVTASSVTDYGDLTGYLSFRGDYNNSPGGAPGAYGDTAWYLDDAWLSIGPLMVGSQASTFNYAWGYTGYGKVLTSYQAADQIRLTWAMGGFGVMLGIEDPRDRWGTLTPYSFNTPDLVAAVTASQSNWDGKLAVGFAQIGSGSSAWGVNGGITIKLDSIAPGDALRLAASYGNGFYTGYGYTGTDNNSWTAFAAFKHFWTPQLSSGLDISYGAYSGASQWKGGLNLVWAPVSGFSASLNGYYAQTGSGAGSWTGKIALVRSW